jgi:hypothetical protein
VCVACLSLCVPRLQCSAAAVGAADGAVIIIVEDGEGDGAEVRGTKDTTLLACVAVAAVVACC